MKQSRWSGVAPARATPRPASPSRVSTSGRHLGNLSSNHVRPALAAAKIKRPVRIYDLRHGFATSGLEAGRDVKDVATLMGHRSTRTTQDRYQHVSEARKREAAERIAELLHSN